jgi:hypothetical protein
VIKCLLALVANQALIDKQSNALSVISILDELTVPVLPGLLASISAVFILHRDPEDASKQELVVTAGMMQSERQKFPFTADFQDKLSSRAIATMQGIPIPAPGVFRVEIGLNDEVLGSWDVVINSVISQQFITSAIPSVPATGQLTASTT